MHVIIDKKTKKVLHINYREATHKLAGETLFDDFDQDTMESCWTDETYVPMYFNVNKKGKIVELNTKEKIESGILELHPSQKLEGDDLVLKSIDEQLDEGIISLDDIKKDSIKYFSDLAFAKRRELIPDYKLNNTTLGVYDEEISNSYRQTIKAFRNEFYRLKEEIESASKLTELMAMKEKFPNKILNSKKQKS